MSRAKKVSERWSEHWTRVRHFSYPLAVVVAIRAIGAVWLYHLLSIGGEFHTAWMDANPRLIPEWNPILNPSSSSNWLWLFNAWDSPHFQLIAQSGYAHPDYAYLPAYPLLIHFVALLAGNYWLAGFVVAQAFALGSVLMFQLLAESYMPQREALCATLLMATFPYIFVFTTLSYSEPLFLFSTISAWYLYKKERRTASSMLAGLAAVTKIYGFAIIVPMLLDIVKSRRWRDLVYVAIPLVFLASWLLFCYFSTGDIFASLTDEKWFTSNISSKFGLIQTIANQLLGRLVGAAPAPFYIDPPILIALGLFAYLVVKSWQVDGSLSAYPLVVFGLTVFVVTNQLSLLRYLTFLFPIWLTMRVKNLFLTAACIIFFVPLALLLWFYAINVTFIG